MTRFAFRFSRDFQILWVTRGLSRLGTQISGIAVPLLVLRMTRSPADAGLVGFAEGVAVAAALLPGGVIADRWNRRAVMAVSDAGCLAAMAVLSAAILLGHAPLGIVVPVAVVIAALGASYSSAAGAALRLIVPDADMTAAVSASQARNAAAALAGPALGGLLFEISPSLPFLADVVSYGISLLGTLALAARLAAPARPGRGTRLLTEMFEGVAFIYRTRVLRFTMIVAAVLNFALEGVLLSLIVATVKGGYSGLTTGTVVAFVGAGSLVGSLLVPAAGRRLSLRAAVIILTGSCAALVAAMALTRVAAVLAVLLAAAALLVPALNVIVSTTQTLLTPDALQGRVQSALSFVAVSLSPLGSAAAGFLLSRWSPMDAFGVFAALIAVLAVASSASRSLRDTGPADKPAVPLPASR